MRRLAPLVLALPLVLGGGAARALPATSCPLFPADNVWHADVSALPVHPRSAAWLASASAGTKHLHPDFGPSGAAVPYGIPFQVVPSSHAKVHVTFDYADESDPGPYPLGDDTPIEGGAGSGGDMHALVVDTGTCTLYETWDTQHQASGWTAGSGATFDLRSNALRPAGWTSADAAGLPILPGLLRLDEVQAGHVDHAIRFTVARTDRSYLWPARHQAGAANDPSLAPMGARFRLKASYPVTGLRADTRTVLAAMKTYGLMLADNGSDWFFQGDASSAWPTALLDELKAVPASAFEAVDESSLMVSPDSAAVRGASTPRPVWTHWSPPHTSAPAAPRRTSSPAAPTATYVSPAPMTPRPAAPSRTPSRSASPDAVVRDETAPPVVTTDAAAPRRKEHLPWVLLVVVGAVAGVVGARVLGPRLARRSKR